MKLDQRCGEGEASSKTDLCPEFLPGSTAELETILSWNVGKTQHKQKVKERETCGVRAVVTVKQAN